MSVRTMIRKAARFGALASLVPALLAAPALASTWIVDVNNGPGTNFTDIPPALAVAVPGDVILVRAGSYSAVQLFRGISILGQGTVSTASVVIGAVPAGETAVVSNIRPWMTNTIVNGCTGTVLLQNVMSEVEVTGSADVRVLKGSNSPGLVGIGTWRPAVKIGSSRVQIVQSTYQGASGVDASCSGDAGDGSAALDCRNGTRLHFALSSATGGAAGLGGWTFCGFMSSGDSGDGVLAYPTSSASPVELVMVGGGGLGLAQKGGNGGTGVSMRLSQYTTAWSSQMTYLPSGPIGGGTFILTPTIEPTLELSGTPGPGAIITLRLRAEPGTVARLNVGRTPALVATPNVLVERLLQVQQSFDLGTVPASGLIDRPWQYRRATAQGDLLIFQAQLVSPANGAVQRSNSIEALVP